MRYGHFGALAAGIALLGVGEFPALPTELPTRHKAIKRPDPYPEASRKQRRTADRSRKQYLIKGVRP